MRCTLPPIAGARPKAGGPLGPKRVGGRPLPRRGTGDGDVGGEKYSSLDAELDASAPVGIAGACPDVWAELSDESGDGGRARRACERVNIFICPLKSSYLRYTHYIFIFTFEVTYVMIMIFYFILFMVLQLFI